jgi:DNA-binding IclR family transcriptional regulator
VAGGSAEPGRPVTARALDLLGAFDTGHRRLTLTQLAGRAHLPMATAHRLVAELAAWGALTRRADGCYEVGDRLWTLGLLAPVQGELREVAAPFLQDLFAATGDTVHLAVREGDRALYVERLSGKASVPVVSQVGGRLPLHTTGVGKVLLAHAPPEVVRHVMAHLTRETRHSVVQPGRMARELGEIRRRGFARTSEEMSLGACSVAVPVHDADDAVVAAVGVVAPSVRRDLVRLVPALQVAAHGIARQLRQFH